MPINYTHQHCLSAQQYLYSMDIIRVNLLDLFVRLGFYLPTYLEFYIKNIKRKLKYFII